jgi:hypothetical protein
LPPRRAEWYEARVRRRLAWGVWLAGLATTGCFHTFDKTHPDGGDGPVDVASDGDADVAPDADAPVDADATVVADATADADAPIDADADSARDADATVDADAARDADATVDADAAPDADALVEAGSAPCPAASNGSALPFLETFETYTAGPLVNAAGSPWIRASQSREGNVSTSWVHGGAHDLEIYSYSTSVETHYVPFTVAQSFSRIDVELWYAPDGYFVYVDFATFGLGCARSKFALEPVVAVQGQDHSLVLKKGGAPATLWNEVDYGKAAFAETEPAAAIHNYVRLELDFAKGELRTFVGPTTAAPLRSTVPIAKTASFNAFFVSGGLNPTYIDDVVITPR